LNTKLKINTFRETCRDLIPVNQHILRNVLFFLQCIFHKMFLTKKKRYGGTCNDGK
jgi:hypothetical protein